MIKSSNPSLAAFLISSSLTLASFLLVRALTSSVSESVTICDGVKCLLVRGTKRWNRARRPCGVDVSEEAAEVMGATNDLDVSLVSL